MDLFAALRLKALLAVTKPDEEADLRYIFRWYSKTFHTPLHQVAELDPADVLTAFYETTFEEMTEEERAKDLYELLERPSERRLRLKAKDEERAEIYTFAKLAESQEAAKAEKKRLADLEVAKQQTTFKPVKPPETSLKVQDLKNLPQEIEMKFATAESFEDLLDGPSTGPSTPERKKG